jgi:hypothetical protein
MFSIELFLLYEYKIVSRLSENVEFITDLFSLKYLRVA